MPVSEMTRPWKYNAQTWRDILIYETQPDYKALLIQARDTYDVSWRDNAEGWVMWVGRDFKPNLNWQGDSISQISSGVVKFRRVLRASTGQRYHVVLSMWLRHNGYTTNTSMDIGNNTEVYLIDGSMGM